MNMPVIQSVGPPPEKHAVRIVGAMMRWLWLEHERQWREILLPAVRAGRSRLGNPIAQEKFARRILAAGKDVTVEVHLVPGKRNNWRLTLFDWCVGTPDGDPYDACPPDSESVSLILTRTDFINKKGREVDLTSRVLLTISFHALVRAAERAGVRTPTDLIRIMREIAIAVKVFGQEKPRPCPPEGYRVPFASGTAIVGLHREHMTFIVKTIL